MCCTKKSWYWIFIADYQNSGASSGGEENTPKKRRITGTKRIEFETTYAKASTWLQKALESIEQMDHHQNVEENDDIDEMNTHLDAINQLNSEIKEWRAMIRQAMTLGI